MVYAINSNAPQCVTTAEASNHQPTETNDHRSEGSYEK